MPSSLCFDSPLLILWAVRCEPNVLRGSVVDAQAAAVAALREEAIRGPRFGLDSLNSALGQEHVPGPVATCPFNPTHK